MIGNPIPWGSGGWVILEEGDLNPRTLQLDVRHYLVARPSGDTVEGTFTLEQAKAYILAHERKGLQKE